MKVVFTHENIEGVSTSLCDSDALNEDGLSLLACILTDDGGTSKLNTFQCIDDGLNLISSIKNRDIEHADWSRETWGAKLTINEARIYHLSDDGYYQLFSLNAFEKALLEWKNFLQSNPEEGARQEIEIL